VEHVFLKKGCSNLLVCLLLSLPAYAEDPALGSLFDEFGVTGTMVVTSQHGNQTFTHNMARSEIRFAAASTFKILNSLIALEEKVIGGANDNIKWDGRHYEIPGWNRDQTLASAFRVSCVWCYQRFAQNIGADKYRQYLNAAGYGHLVEPFKIAGFWLDGSLLISANEQIEFLRKVHLRTLPFSTHAYDTLAEIMLAERAEPTEHAPGYRLWAKSGWATRNSPQVGWYVGYVETQNDVWYFATNIEIRNKADLALRQRLTIEALKIKGVLN
jgi:beta-lactamase class D